MLDKINFNVTFNSFEKPNILEVKSFLSLYSSNSKFEDDVWIMDKLLSNQNVSRAIRTVYFNKILETEREILKIFTLIKLSGNASVRTVKANIYGIQKLLNFLSSRLNRMKLVDVNKKVINEFEAYLRDTKVSNRSKEAIWGGVASFYTELSRHEIIPLINIRKNPFSIPRHKRASTKKYIDDYVIKQLDTIFYNEEIPLVYRTTYWICRLIPNRISEVSSIKFGCIKPYINEKIISIPTFKQNGGYEEPEMKQIAIKEEGMGKFLLDLIRKQEMASMALQKYVNEKDKGYLLTAYTSQYIPTQRNYVLLDGNINKIMLVNEPNFNKILNTYCKRYGVKDKNGEQVKISSHMFRHNGITDRLYEGFRLIDIIAMTNHKSSGMIVENYVHVKEKELRSISEKVISEGKSEVLFRGKIINTNNPEKMDKILRKSFAHKIGRLGICSDISNCPSQMFECLNDCPHFIPNADELGYFEEQVNQWEDKMIKFRGNPYMEQNAKYNLDLNRRVVERIKRAIEEN